MSSCKQKDLLMSSVSKFSLSVGLLIGLIVTGTWASRSAEGVGLVCGEAEGLVGTSGFTFVLGLGCLDPKNILKKPWLSGGVCGFCGVGWGGRGFCAAGRGCRAPTPDWGCAWDYQSLTKQNECNLGILCCLLLGFHACHFLQNCSDGTITTNKIRMVCVYEGKLNGY